MFEAIVASKSLAGALIEEGMAHVQPLVSPADATCSWRSALAVWCAGYVEIGRRCVCILLGVAEQLIEDLKGRRGYGDESYTCFRVRVQGQKSL